MRDRPFQPCVYLMASDRNGTLYCGVTSDLVRRVWEHREGHGSRFAEKYGVLRLVWFEHHATMDAAILREKQIKKWNRAWKLRLIEEANPRWTDLFETLTY
jgi:putative endonuclease